MDMLIEMCKESINFPTPSGEAATRINTRCIKAVLGKNAQQRFGKNSDFAHHLIDRAIGVFSAMEAHACRDKLVVDGCLTY